MNNSNDFGDFYMGRTRIRPNRPPERRLPPGILTAAVLLIFVGIIWYAYPDKDSRYADLDVPVVQAENESIKEVPSEQTGMEIPHQDSTIFEGMDEKSDDAFVKDVEKGGKVEKILPTEEQPMDKKVILQSKGVLNGFAPEPRTAPDNRIVDKVEMMDNKVDRDAALSGSVKTAPVVEHKAAAVVAVKDVVKPKKEETKSADMPNVVKNTYVQLGSYREKELAEKDWWRFKKRYSEILKNLDYKIIDVDLKAKGVYHRLHAGKLTLEQAKSVCAQINEQKNGSCIIVK